MVLPQLCCFRVAHQSLQLVHYSGIYCYTHNACTIMHYVASGFLIEIYRSQCRVSFKKKKRFNVHYFPSHMQVIVSVHYWCVSVLGSASHPRQLAYIQAFVINKQDFKAYYLCVHS